MRYIRVIGIDLEIGSDQLDRMEIKKLPKFSF
jgi:hypothetical protein